MAVTEVLKKVAVNVNLNDGVDSEGKVRTVTTGLGTLNANTWDADKAYNIVSALLPCLSKVLYDLTSVKTNNMLNS